MSSGVWNDILYKENIKQYYIYILSNIARRVLYTGVTDDLVKRVWQHKNEVVEGFTQKYKIHDLIYYEIYEDVNEAIEREKQIKSWNRNRKEKLIIQMNPQLTDLYDQILG